MIRAVKGSSHLRADGIVGDGGEGLVDGDGEDGVGRVGNWRVGGAGCGLSMAAAKAWAKATVVG